MEVTRDQLTSAFARPSVRIAIDKFSARDGGDYTEGHVRYPQVAADAVMGALREIVPPAGCDCMADPEPAPVADDPEIALMAHTLAVLRTLDADTVQRYRQWVDERFVRTHPF